MAARPFPSRPNGSRPGALLWLAVAASLALCSARAQSQLQPVAEEPAATQPALHDQTQRVVLLAPGLTSDTVAELVQSLAPFGVGATTLREAKLDPTLEACGTLGCLAELARASQAPVTLVNVSSPGEGARTLLLVLVDEDGHNAQVRTRIGEAGLAPAFVAAWKEVRMSLAGQSMIHVETRPSGAMVLCDGVPAGYTPWARHVEPGRHRVRVELEGFLAQERVVDAPVGRLQRVELLLKRGPRFDGRQLTTAAATSPWNDVLGGTLALLAVPALIASVNALIADGQCLEASAAGCRNRADYGTRDAYLFAFGLVALAGGGALILARPLEMSETGP